MKYNYCSQDKWILFLFLLFFGVNFYPTSLEAAIAPPVAEYRLDECLYDGTAGEVRDSSGNRLHGQAILPPVTIDVSDDSTGGVCQAVSMGGVSHLSIPDNNLLDIPNALTAMAWIKPNSFPSGGNIKSILSKDTNYEFHIDSSKRIYWWWQWQQGGTSTRRTYNNTLTQGEWAHVVIRLIDGVSTIFLDGVIADQYDWNTTKTLRTNNDILQIGGDFIGTRYFDGAIDEVMVFDVALSDQDVQIIYNSQKAGKNYDNTERNCPECETLSEKIVLSIHDNSLLGTTSLAVESSELVEFTPDSTDSLNAMGTGRLVRDLADSFIWGPWNVVDAAHIDSTGDIYFSTYQDSTLPPTGDPTTVYKNEILQYHEGEVVRIIKREKLFHNNYQDTNIDALYYFEDKDTFLISADRNFKLQGGGNTVYDRNDLVEITIDYKNDSNKNGLRSHSLYFDGSQHLSSDSNINGVHVLSDQQLLITSKDESNTNNSVIGALGFKDGDIVQYAPTPRVAEEFFIGTQQFTNSGGSPAWENVDAITTVSSNVVVDHYEIMHDGFALACGSPEIVTIFACLNSDCSTLLSSDSTVAMTISPFAPATAVSASWIGGGETIINNGEAEKSLVGYVGETVTLGIEDETVIPTNGYRCVNVRGGSAVDCEIELAEAGFEFVTSVGDPIPTQTSCKTSENIIIRAMKKDDESERCVPLFQNDTISIPFYSTYEEPSTGSESLRINPSSGSAVDIASSQPGTSVDLLFNDTGEATFQLMYPDAGKIQLNAEYIGTGDELGLVMSGSSSFVIHPAGLCVYSAQTGNECTSGDQNCSVFTVAGKEFLLNVKGVCWEQAGEADEEFCTGTNTTTSNFIMSNIGISHQLVAPSTGVTGDLTVTQTAIVADGEIEITDQTISEVGVFKFSAIPDRTFNYHGVVDVFAGTTFTSANIGRFIPDHFEVTILPDPPEFTDECNDTFTYLGEPFNWNSVPDVTITAMSGAASPEKTTNYEGDFWKLNTIINYGYVDVNVPTNASPFTPETSSKVINNVVDINGVGTIALSETDGFNYTRPAPTIPVSPFSPDVTLSISQSELRDSDGVCYKESSVCADFTFENINGVNIRHGLSLASNVFGPGVNPLVMPVQTHWYTGTSWELHDDDDCTSFSYVMTESGLTVSSVPASPSTMSLGEVNLILTPTSMSTNGTVLIDFDFPDWLHPDPSATATFGISRGNDRIINWQEINR